MSGWFRGFILEVRFLDSPYFFKLILSEFPMLHRLASKYEIRIIILLRMELLFSMPTHFSIDKSCDPI